MKGYNDNHKLFDIKPYLEQKPKLEKRIVSIEDKQKTIQETSTSELKGVESTMKKHCSKRKDGRWQYSKQKDGYLYYTIANTYRELIEKIKRIKPRKIKTIKRFEPTP